MNWPLLADIVFVAFTGVGIGLAIVWCLMKLGDWLEWRKIVKEDEEYAKREAEEVRKFKEGGQL